MDRIFVGESAEVLPVEDAAGWFRADVAIANGKIAASGSLGEARARKARFRADRR